MHQTPAFVNGFYASVMALHFWPIFAPSPPKTAEIRHFPSASAIKTVELQLGGLHYPVPDRRDVPSGRSPPPGFGIVTRRTGAGRYVFSISSALRPESHS